MSTQVLDRELHVGSTSSSATIEPRRARVHLFGELVPGWRVENPLPLCVEQDTDGRFIASDDIFDLYGVGGSWDAAIRDYKVALVEFFEIAGNRDDLASRRLLDHLKAYLRRG